MWNWRAGLGLMAILAVLIVTVMPVPAQDPPVRAIVPAAAAAPQARTEGDAFQGMFSIEGKEVPLPTGSWRLAGRAVTNIDHSASHAVVSVALVRLRGTTVDSAILIQTNRLDTEASWGKASACERTDLYFARIRYASDHDGSCAYAAYVNAATRLDTAVDPAWKQAMMLGSGLSWQFPIHWLEAAYRITDPRDAIQVRYLFNPAAGEGAPVSQANVASLIAWIEASWYAVGSGFRNRLGPDSELPDWRSVDNASARILKPVGEETSETEHIGAKMITYRIFGTLTDMSVNYLWLGSLPSAGGLAIVSAMASSALYFFHELAWNRFEQPNIDVGDLSGVGPEVPGPGRI